MQHDASEGERERAPHNKLMNTTHRHLGRATQVLQEEGVDDMYVTNSVKKTRGESFSLVAFASLHIRVEQK